MPGQFMHCRLSLAYYSADHHRPSDRFFILLFREIEFTEKLRYIDIFAVLANFIGLGHFLGMGVQINYLRRGIFTLGESIAVQTQIIPIAVITSIGYRFSWFGVDKGEFE
jgi:choline-glycine betaine transporter